LDQAALDRELAPALLRTRLEAGPYSADQAAELGLVDKVGQVHEAEARLLDEAGANAELFDLMAYARSLRGGDAGGGPAIAVI
ncbi:MAG TPA: signal peptide peptidase SppA, partial [Phenylobacterium sp.]|nr:signal peptide peptidase SppA [Phenylobacterium sp.]